MGFARGAACADAAGAGADDWVCGEDVGLGFEPMPRVIAEKSVAVVVSLGRVIVSTSPPAVVLSGTGDE
jgi:hypothetical protein